MTKYNFKLYVFVSAVLIGLSSCHTANKETTETETTESLPENIVELRDDQIKLAEIDTGHIELRSMNGTLKVSGTVASAPQNLATVCMPMGGIVKSTTLVPGNYVAKGQRLATLENPEFIDIQQNYLEAKSKLEYTQADYIRQKELFQNDVSSKKNFQLVTSEYKSLKAQVNALAQKLSLIGINPYRLTENNITRSVSLLSPISGVVETVNVSIGKSVSSSDVLFEIVNSSKLFLKLTLFDKDANKVSNGQKIHFFINNETEQHEATIYQTAKTIDTDKTYKVYANITSKCTNVIPGMYVNAVIETSSERVPSVPSEAVVNFEDKDYIFIFNKKKKENGRDFTEYRMIEVRKGVSDGQFTEISLPEGFAIQTANVVTKGAYNLLSAKKNAGEMAC